MKFGRSILNVSSIVAFFGLSSGLGFAQSTLNLSSTSGAPGAAASLDLSLNASQALAGVQWTISYSAADLTAIDVSAGPGLGSDKTLLCASSTGAVTCLVDGPNDDSINNGVIAVVTATAASPATSSSISLGINSTVAVSADGTSKSLTGGDGSLTVQAPTVPSPASALVAAYAFNEGRGSTAADLSGNGHPGHIQGATWTTRGRYGSALVFNGSNSLISVPDATALHLTTGMTLEAWVNPGVLTSSWQDVIYKGNDNYFLEATSTKGSVPAGGSTFGVTYGTALALNTWTHLALTYDGSVLRLYVNGLQSSTLAHSGSLPTSTQPLQIGGNSIFGQFFKGIIDEVRIYDVALSNAQIQTDMNTPLSTARR